MKNNITYIFRFNNDGKPKAWLPTLVVKIAQIFFP